MKVLVVGDVMLDKFTSVTPIRMSDEAPVLIVRENDSQYALGGAGNVALNIKKLNIDTTILGIIGTDRNGQLVKNLLAEEGIESILRLGHEDVPTIVKQRILVNNQQLIRLDTEKAVNEELIVPGNSYDAIVVSDYAKGTISEFLMMQLKQLKKKFIVVNGKPNQINLYEDVDILTFNKKEFEDCKVETGCQSGEHICGRFNIKYLVVTLGKDGIAIYTETKRVQIKGLPVQVVDVTGAGDTVIAALTYAMLKYNKIEKALELANKAGSLVVQKAKTAYVTLQELGE